MFIRVYNDKLEVITMKIKLKTVPGNSAKKTMYEYKKYEKELTI